MILYNIILHKTRFWDYKTAFPAVTWNFLWMVLQVAGFPWNVIRAIRKLYENAVVSYLH